jgi:hypothetical protein
MPWFDSIRDATGHNFVRRLDVDTAMQCSVKGTAQRITTMHFRHDVPNVVWSRDAVMDEDAPNQDEIECRAVFMVATLLTCNLGHPRTKSR